MRQVIFGFLPWIVFWSLSGPDLWTPAILGALLAAALLVVWRWFARRDLKSMEVVTLGYFAVHALLTLGLHSPLLKTYGPIANSLVLAGMAWGTLLAGSPFTYEYAREDWPRALWQNPLFRRTNQIITLVWGVIFLGNSGLGGTQSQPAAVCPIAQCHSRQSFGWHRNYLLCPFSKMVSDLHIAAQH